VPCGATCNRDVHLRALLLLQHGPRMQRAGGAGRATPATWVLGACRLGVSGHAGPS
jgi:hypothetical protein